MKKIFATMGAAAALFALASCEKYDDKFSMSPNNSVMPSKVAESGFKNQVPAGADVWDVEWDYEGTYWEVSYETGTRPHGTEYTMYFDLDGNWLATKTEILLKNVPQNIMDALAASEYGNQPIEDYEVDFFETPTGGFYRFEFEVRDKDINVDIDLDGKVSVSMEFDR